MKNILIFILPSSIVLSIFSKVAFPPLQITTSKGPFLLTAENVPKNSFIISSFSNSSSFSMTPVSYIREYQDFSIENYLKNLPQLLLSPDPYYETLPLSVSVCSFQSISPEQVKLKFSYELPESSCSDQGSYINGKCQCNEFFTGPDCSISYKVISPHLKSDISMSSYQSLFFTSDKDLRGDRYKIEIDAYKGKINTFITYYSEHFKDNLPSFLSRDNYKEIFVNKFEIFATDHTEHQYDTVFSLLCLDEDGCKVKFNIILLKRHHDDKVKKIIIGVFVSLPFLIIGLALGAILYYRRCKNKRRERIRRDSLRQLKSNFSDVLIEEGNKKELCVICFEGYAVGCVAKKLLCGHVFHNECLDMWVQDNLYCPLCRFDFSHLGDHNDGSRSF